MPVSQDDIDEVLLALEQTRTTLYRDGHQPSPYALENCEACYTLHLVERAIALYITNRRIVAT